MGALGGIHRASWRSALVAVSLGAWGAWLGIAGCGGDAARGATATDAAAESAPRADDARAAGDAGPAPSVDANAVPTDAARDAGCAVIPGCTAVEHGCSHFSDTWCIFSCLADADTSSFGCAGIGAGPTSVCCPPPR